MLIERYQNLTDTEKAESLQRGGFTRDGVDFAYWRTSCHGEAWFRADEPAPVVEFPEIHGTAEALEFAPLEPTIDDYLDPDFRDVLARMKAADDDAEKAGIWSAWLLGGTY